MGFGLILRPYRSAGPPQSREIAAPSYNQLDWVLINTVIEFESKKNIGRNEKDYNLQRPADKTSPCSIVWQQADM